MADYARLEEYEKDEVIFESDSNDCDTFYIIYSGIVGLKLKDSRTKEYYSGDVFGEVAIFHNTFRSGTIHAKRASKLVAIHRDFLFNNPDHKATLVAARVTNILTSQIISYLEELNERPTSEIIAGGENHQVEFKSSITKFTDSTMLETVVAFLNNKGGTIFIGVRDNKEIVGVSMKDKRIDDFRVAFIKQVCERVGVGLAAAVKCNSEYVLQKKVIKIICSSTAQPAFLIEKEGDKVVRERFIVRQDALNKEIYSKKAIAEYVLKRFAK
jgi:CRP-like cAMP-binding protein